MKLTNIKTKQQLREQIRWRVSGLIDSPFYDHIKQMTREQIWFKVDILIWFEIYEQVRIRILVPVGTLFYNKDMTKILW